MWWMCSSAVCATKSIPKKKRSIRSVAWVMSSNLINRLRRTFGFRLNLWYASIFTLSVFALYFFVYVLLSVAIVRKDREVIEAQVNDYSIIYQRGGLTGLRNWIYANQEKQKQKKFFVRLT